LHASVGDLGYKLFRKLQYEVQYALQNPSSIIDLKIVPDHDIPPKSYEILPKHIILQPLKIYYDIVRCNKLEIDGLRKNYPASTTVTRRENSKFEVNSG
jgi:hypothetical protein